MDEVAPSSAGDSGPTHALLPHRGLAAGLKPEISRWLGIQVLERALWRSSSRCGRTSGHHIGSSTLLWSSGLLSVPRASHQRFCVNQTERHAVKWTSGEVVRLHDAPLKGDGLGHEKVPSAGSWWFAWMGWAAVLLPMPRRWSRWLRASAGHP